MKRDAFAISERSLNTVLDVVRHMGYYVAPWQNQDLEKEAAVALGSIFESRDHQVYRHLLSLDPIFGSMLAEYVGTTENSRLVELARNFDLAHNSHLAPTVTLALRSMRSAVREAEPAYVA